jgi:hypothetical protein
LEGCFINMKGNIHITNIVITQKINVVCRYVPITQRHIPTSVTAESIKNENNHDAIFHTVRTYTLYRPSPSPFLSATDRHSVRSGVEAPHLLSPGLITRSYEVLSLTTDVIVALGPPLSRRNRSVLCPMSSSLSSMHM